VRRTAALAALVVCALAPSALADDGPAPAGTTPVPADTTAAPPIYTAPAPDATPAPAPPARDVIPPRVRISGVRVGGLERPGAVAAVRARFERPLTLVFRGRLVHATPAELGAVAFAVHAVAVARHSAPGASVPLGVSVRPGPLRSYLRGLARTLAVAPVDAQLAVRDGRPVLTRDRPGRRIEVEPALRQVSAALAAGRRGPLELPVRDVEPGVTAQSFGPLIVIHRGGNRLDLYRGATLEREFRVATGQTAYPTPLGQFSIVVKWKDPWWYPPASPWAAGEKPTPPGPGNPLGTRWMGLSAPGVGIHGTPDSGSIGYSLSHGCIRMLIPEAEWLFDRVDIGTPVYIVAS
jgi:lipoprotein-anchoring transpeptidase ErfK/SrfK